MVLSMGTTSPDLRSEVESWGSEDPRLYVHGKPIGLTPGTYKSPDCPRHYKTVLEAMADGWKLLGPPSSAPIVNSDGETFPQYDWWLVKDVDADADLSRFASRSPWATIL